MKKLVDDEKSETKSLTEENKNLIYAISSAKHEKLDKDITIDLIEYLVLKRLQKSTSPTEKSQFSVATIIFLIIGLLGLFLSIYLIIGDRMSGDKALPFKLYRDMSVFKDVPCFGKEKFLYVLVKLIFNMCQQMDDKDTDELSQMFTPVYKNFLFFGKPGTGKTVLVKKLAYVLDVYLKYKKVSKKGKKEVNKNNLKGIPSIVNLIIIQPSYLCDKYVGSTERNIRKVFEIAQELSKKQVVLIFIDEIDSFFSKRENTQTEHGINLKSEFLAWLDGINTKLKDKYFIIGATNYEKNIDLAFKRRMAHVYYFPLPGPEERAELIIQQMKNYCWYKPSLVDLMVSLTNGLAQSNIMNAFSNLARKTDFFKKPVTEEMIKKTFEHYKEKQNSQDIIPDDYDLDANNEEELKDLNRFL